MPRKLPNRVYEKHGSYWFVDLERRWHKLCRVADGEAKMYQALAAIIEAPPLSRMPAAIVAFKRDYLVGLAPSTQKEHERLLDIAANEFAGFDVPEVQPVDVSRSVRNLYAGKPTAARSYKARLSTFFRWSVEQGLRTDNPCREVWLKSPPRRDRYITDEEFLAIREGMLTGDDGLPTRAGEIARCFVDLCYLTAQRSTDIRKLLWNQVREDGIAFKPTKTAGSSGAKVVVRLTAAIREVLERARAFGVPAAATARIKSIYVIHALDGSPYTMSGIRSAWVRACRRAGVANATIKDLRAKALTDAERAGYSIEQLRTAAAHSSVTTTEGYVKTFREPVSAVELEIPSK